MHPRSRLVSLVFVSALSSVVAAACGNDSDSTPATAPPLSPFGGTSSSGGQTSVAGTAGTVSAAGMAGTAGSNAPATVCDDVPPGKLALLDDFEDRDSTASVEPQREAYWFTTHDDSMGTIEPDGLLEAQAPGANGSGYAAHVTAAGFSVWGASFSSSISHYAGGVRCPYDASAFTGVRFMARGSGIFRVGVPVPATVDQEFGGSCDPSKGMICYDQHSTALSLKNEWQVFEVPWSALAQRGFGTVAEFRPATIMGVQFTFDPSYLPVDLWLDDVAFWDGVPTPVDMGAGGAGGAGGEAQLGGAGGAGGEGGR